MQIKLLKLLMEKFKQRNMNSNKVLMLTVIIYLFCSCNSNNKDNKDKNDKNTVNPDSVEVISGYGRIGSLNDITDITTEVNGIVEDVFYQAGDSLAEGDTIFSLNHEDEIIRKNQMETELESVNTAISLLEQQIETAKKTLQTKKTYYERLENSFDAGAESQQNVDNAKLEYEQAKSRLNELIFQKKSRSEEYEIQEQMLNRQLLTLDKHFVKSPGKGQLLSLHAEINKAVKALQSFGEFKFAGPYAIRAEIDELYAGEVKKNMKAVAVPYGRSDTLAYGRIIFISPKLNKKSIFSEENSDFMDRRVREIEVRIDSATEEIFIGERVNLIIDIK